MKKKNPHLRKALDLAVKGLSSLGSGIGIAVLFWILFEVVRRGAAAFNPAFFTELPAPPGVEGGGLANAMLGTLMITGLAALFGVPAGMLGGVYLSEYGRGKRFGDVVRFVMSAMMGVPSILVGLFAYGLLVVTSGHFSGWAAVFALAMIMIPIVSRTTEEMLLLVPNALREAALAVGSPRWKVTLSVLFRAARGGLVTGVLLAVARVTGETAPLLFTALNSPYWPDKLSEPTANLTVTIFNYAMSPYENWQRAAWGGSLLIVASVLALTLGARILSREKKT
ncbi:MAG: phosphate ABC transporter permease PstA [Myxococcales bacterium]|nr:phosphate ABC transporter permease PstA [Myxococcales bacterium]